MSRPGGRARAARLLAWAASAASEGAFWASVMRLCAAVLICLSRRFYKGILEVDLDKNKYQPTPGTYEVGGLGNPGNKFPEGGRISPSKRPYHLDDVQKRSAAIPGHKYNLQQSISKDVEGGYWLRSHPKNDGM